MGHEIYFVTAAETARVETEKFYKGIEPNRFKVPDNLVDILMGLSAYCDKHTLSDSDYCSNCPFYTGSIFNWCVIRDNGYGLPHEWAIYKENEVGDVNT